MRINEINWNLAFLRDLKIGTTHFTQIKRVIPSGVLSNLGVNYSRACLRTRIVIILHRIIIRLIGSFKWVSKQRRGNEVRKKIRFD